MKILSIFGTRPEAIKFAPVLLEFRRHRQIESIVCVTAQHRMLLDETLRVFDIKVGYDLNLMVYNQQPERILSAGLKKLSKVIKQIRPDWILVQGDTVTTLAASLAAFFANIPLAHIEAGLRTENKRIPYPEEMNRRLTSYLADRHFAPTQIAKKNLLKEDIPAESILVTGNTVIDALKYISNKIETNRSLSTRLKKGFPYLDKSKKLILITAHRRENFAQRLKNICQALLRITDEFPQVQMVYSVHPNPNVTRPIHEMLKDTEIFLIEPPDYLSFVYLLKQSYFVLTDSGGIQEEAPVLAKPTLVMRDVTERPEAIRAKTARLVGTDSGEIYQVTKELLTNKEAYRVMAKATSPYGDGLASQRITNSLLNKQVCEFGF